MPPEYGRQTGDIGGVYDAALCAQLCDGFLHVDGVPVCDGIKGEAKSSKLFFLPLAQGVAHLATISVVDFPCKFVTKLLAVELNKNTPPEVSIVDVVQDMHSLDKTPQMHEGSCEGCGPFPNLQNAHDACGLQMPKFEGSGETNEVFPVFNDEFGIYGALSNCIEGAIVSRFVGTPKPCTTDISQARAKLVAQECESACKIDPLRWVISV